MSSTLHQFAMFRYVEMYRRNAFEICYFLFVCCFDLTFVTSQFKKKKLKKKLLSLVLPYRNFVFFFATYNQYKTVIEKYKNMTSECRYRI